MTKVGRKQFGQTPDERAVIKLIKLRARIRKGGARPSLASIARYLNDKGYSTQSGKLWRAQTVKNVLAAEFNLIKQPARIKKTSLTTGDYLSKGQLSRLFNAAETSSHENKMIVAVLVGSGLRASELCALQIRDLGIHGGKGQIDVRRGKGSKQRSVFISTQLSASLRGYLWGKQTPKKSLVFTNCFREPLTYDALYKRIKKMGQLAGMPGLHPHALRHTFGTLLYHYKKDLFFVMEQLGHSKVTTTQIYAKTLTESKLEQINAFGSDIAGLLEGQALPDKRSKPENSV